MKPQSRRPAEAPNLLAGLPGEVTAAWQAPMHALREGQAEWLEGSRTLWASWLQRRQQALETGLEALGRIGACRTPSQMSAICDAWVTGSMERLAADMNETRDLMARLADHAQQSMGGVFAQGGENPSAPSPAAAPEPLPEAARVRSKPGGDGSREARVAQD
ncbi:phasin family protein [Oceaniglobus roseus]|uniref:phasin family protein n=1 Tax=Oceaniglobus roseus TaxID=1737570 RepID=UPI000C7EB0EB|nr:phasin family protein [Kandeliimicrobium roseum]